MRSHQVRYLVRLAISGCNFRTVTWILDRFSDKFELKRIFAFCGIISMISLLYVTFTTEESNDRG